MRVLVDTSVWVDFFNDHASAEAATLTRLIEDDADIVTCGLVAAEVLQGLRKGKSRDAVVEHFCLMEWLTPDEPGTYVEAADLFAALRRKGTTIRSTIDCLIAVLAADAGALILAKDRDIHLIARSGLVQLKQLPVVQ